MVTAMTATTTTALANLRSVMALRMMANYGTTVSTRAYSTKKPPSAVSQFYKQFTRPVAKTLLIAVFTYQLAYWAWAKAEADEIRADRDATIAGLETTVKAYQEKTKSTGEKTS
ncbi:hypothetical protein B0J13DRAFT_548546 [Dactylonectria estremocensis]|uniref:Uncharacterized protein n=1 Tax=Dactylonectria estremocensis TaxID=1079267 RepID=A0A9P9J7N0_9HYPO|nr:hypothetical protein B0J13DRAFT_548546 [Dactylonectria estremocensis]